MLYERKQFIGRTRCNVIFAVIAGPWYPAEFYGGAVQHDNTPWNNGTHFYFRDSESAAENAQKLFTKHNQECASCAYLGVYPKEAVL